MPQQPGTSRGPCHERRHPGRAAPKPSSRPALRARAQRQPDGGRRAGRGRAARGAAAAAGA
ncbi:hypothetical protein HMPREF0731_1659, partial [Pseudoroseomonas cervicalis ATCC 49957]